MLKLITAPTGKAVEVSRARARLHIDADDFDDDLASLIEVATLAVEQQSSRTIRVSSWEWRIDGWPGTWPLTRFDGQAILGWPALCVPAAPIRDITAVKYLDENDVEQTIDPAYYSWVRTEKGADINFVRAFTLPVLSLLPQCIRVAFDAGYDDVPERSGYGDDPELKMPPQVEMAILFLVAHWHRNREPVVEAANALQNVPNSFQYLVDQIRIYR